MKMAGLKDRSGWGIPYWTKMYRGYIEMCSTQLSLLWMEIYLLGGAGTPSGEGIQIRLLGLKIKPDGDTLWTKKYGGVGVGMIFKFCQPGMVISCSGDTTSPNSSDTTTILDGF